MNVLQLLFKQDSPLLRVVPVLALGILPRPALVLQPDLVLVLLPDLALVLQARPGFGLLPDLALVILYHAVLIASPGRPRWTWRWRQSHQGRTACSHTRQGRASCSHTCGGAWPFLRAYRWRFSSAFERAWRAGESRPQAGPVV